MEQALYLAFRILTWLILVYFLLLNIFYFFFTILSIFGLRRYRNLTAFVHFRELFHLPMIKPISIIAPAFNEESTIIESVHSLLSLEYPHFEIVVVNDGSKDKTLEKLISDTHSLLDHLSPAELLGVSEEATLTEIRDSYKKLSGIYHPKSLPRDSSPTLLKQAAEIFEQMTDCRELLLEASKRKPRKSKTQKQK